MGRIQGGTEQMLRPGAPVHIKRTEAWILLSACATPGKSLHLSSPHFPHLQVNEGMRAYLAERIKLELLH